MLHLHLPGDLQHAVNRGNDQVHFATNPCDWLAPASEKQQGGGDGLDTSNPEQRGWIPTHLYPNELSWLAVP